MQIFVKAHKTYIIEAEKDTLINDIKNTINNKLKLQTNNYYLIANGKVLENNKFVEDYKIDNFTTIYIYFRPTPIIDNLIQFFVKLDKSYTFVMSKSETLDDLMDNINSRFNFKDNKFYYLIFNGKLLEDRRKTLKDYNISHDCNINLIFRQNVKFI